MRDDWSSRALAAAAVLLGATPASPALAEPDRIYEVQAEYADAAQSTDETTRLGLQARDSKIAFKLRMEVEDPDRPSSLVRVTLRLAELRFESDLSRWRRVEFDDAEALRRAARDFLGADRTRPGAAELITHEQEAMAWLLTLAHGRPLVVDLSSDPHAPDPRLYQADALLYEAIRRDDEPLPPMHGSGTFEPLSAHVAERLRHRVTDGSLPRADRWRLLLWGHVKHLVLFMENRRYRWFDPLPAWGEHRPEFDALDHRRRTLDPYFVLDLAETATVADGVAWLDDLGDAAPGFGGSVTALGAIVSNWAGDTSTL